MPLRGGLSKELTSLNLKRQLLWLKLVISTLVSIRKEKVHETRPLEKEEIQQSQIQQS